MKSVCPDEYATIETCVTAGAAVDLVGDSAESHAAPCVQLPVVVRFKCGADPMVACLCAGAEGHQAEKHGNETILLNFFHVLPLILSVALRHVQSHGRDNHAKMNGALDAGRYGGIQLSGGIFVHARFYLPFGIVSSMGFRVSGLIQSRSPR